MTRTSLISTIATLTALVVGGIALRSWLEAHDDRLQMQATLDAQKQLIILAEQREQQRSAELKDTLAQIADLKRQVQTPQQIIRELPQYLPLPQPIQFAPAGPPQAQSQAPAITTNPVQQGGGIRVSPTQTGAAQVLSATGAPIQQATATGTTTPAPAHLGSRLEPQFPPNAANTPPVNPLALPQGNAAPAARAADTPSAVQFPVEDLKPLYDFVQDCRACKAQLDAARADLTDERSRSVALVKERDAAIKAAKGGNFWSRLGHNIKWFALGAGAGVILTRTAH